MNSSSESITTAFYTSFKEKDSAGMCENYHPSLKFNDPAFGDLSYEQTCNMWKMLCESAKDLSIDFEILKSDEDRVETQWIAEYTFSKSGRKVRNVINAHMKFSEGKIIEHIDVFNLHKWAKQAIGLQGWLLGGTSFFKNKLQLQTGKQLRRYMEKSGAD